jgi:hypothetical protein
MGGCLRTSLLCGEALLIYEFDSLMGHCNQFRFCVHLGTLSQQFVRLHLVLVSAPSRVPLIFLCLPFSLRPPTFTESGPVKNRNSASRTTRKSARTTCWQSCGWQTMNTAVLLAYPCTTPKVCTWFWPLFVEWRNFSSFFFLGTRSNVNTSLSMFQSYTQHSVCEACRSLSFSFLSFITPTLIYKSLLSSCFIVS